ncbi:ABC transporter substrate-binding protein [Aliikangiella sp. IMCC44359]|uniref:ABC transporter substrate-binding protein n=1 Tax=Aliikangiella sp. IMCC44359 TaxID=3459125 RepID=UPI00403AC6B3
MKALNQLNFFFLSTLFFSTNISANNLVTPDKKSIVSCNRKIHFSKVPKRAVSNDINMTEMMLALGLQDNMVGYTGIESNKNNNQILNQYPNNLTALSRHAPNIETLLTHNVDFLFAGWNYGLKIGGSLTPKKLAAFDIPVYELAESCIHIMPKKSAGFDDIYTDLTNLGIIFSKQDAAKNLITKIKSSLFHLSKATVKTIKPNIFLFDSGFDSPFTSGRYGMPNAIIEAAGGNNIFSDLQTSWTRASWEAVIEKNPDLIIIVDYGNISAQEKINFLTNEPALSTIKAIKNNHFIVLTYNEVTPSIQAFNATIKLHSTIHSKKNSIQ